MTGRVPSIAKGLPGKRVDAYRAGITAKHWLDIDENISVFGICVVLKILE
jgi:hypothetical protein